MVDAVTLILGAVRKKSSQTATIMGASLYFPFRIPFVKYFCGNKRVFARVHLYEPKNGNEFRL